MATTTNFAVSVGTTATEIIAAKAERTSFYIENAEAVTTIFVGGDNTITTVTGLPVQAGGIITEDMGHRMWKGPIFGIVATGTADVRVWDRSHR